MRVPLIMRQPVFLVLLGCCAIATQATRSLGQVAATTLPPNWQQLSPDDFAALVRQHFETFKSLSESDQEELASHGAELFSQIDVSNTPLNYQTLEMLQWVGRGLLDQDVIQRAKRSVMVRQDNWAGRPYAEIRAKVVMMMRLKVPDPVSVMEARRWVLAGGTIEQVPQKDLSYDIVRQVFADLKVVNNSFSVEWLGKLSAPRTGDYTFFISPININAGYHTEPLNFSMNVSLAEQQVITASPPNGADLGLASYVTRSTPSTWASQSSPVPLTAGVPVAIRVQVNIDAPAGLPTAALHAMLFWQGPGIAKSLVPVSAFSQPQTGTPGLQASYGWTTKGRQQSMTRTDPAIDFAWTNSPLLLAQDPTIANQSADAMWQLMTATDFITSYISVAPVRLHPFLRDPDDASSGLSTGRRGAFLDLLLQNPALLDAANAKDIVRFFQAFRLGTPDKALNVFGAWAARNADLPSEISDDPVFEGDMRRSFAWLAILTTQQLPSQAGRLQAKFLQLPDGRCALPVAYTLAFSYLGRHKMSDWIGVLDGKLADPAVGGELRVNWLIARAFAEELRRLPPRHYPFRYPMPSSWPLDGIHFLNQAVQASQSAATKVRAAKEIVGRLAWARRFTDATHLLQQVSGSLPSDQKALTAAWQQQLATLAAKEAKVTQDAPAAAARAYVQSLKVRRDAAAQRGDTAGAGVMTL